MSSENSQVVPSATQILFTASGGAAANLQFPALAVRLDRTNYSLWRGTVRSALEAYELEGFLTCDNVPSQTLPPVTGSTTCEPNPAFSTWRRKDRLVLLWLRSTLTTPMLGHVARAVTTSEVWIMLEQTFHSQTRARQMHLKQQLQMLSKGNLSILEYVEKKRTISDSLAECLTVISDEDFVSYVLFGLGAEYSAFKTALSMRLEPISSNELLGLLLQEEQRILDSLADSSFPSANVAHRRSFSGRQPLPESAASGDRPRLVCQICTKAGHDGRNCHQRLNLSAFPATNRRAADRLRQLSAGKQAFAAYPESPSAITDPWVIDSGATNHVIADRSRLNLQSE